MKAVLDFTFLSGWEPCGKHAPPPIIVQDATLPCAYCTGRDKLLLESIEPQRVPERFDPHVDVGSLKILRALWRCRRIGYHKRRFLVWEFMGMR